MPPYGKQIRDQYPTDYEILNISTNGDGWMPVEFSQPVNYFRIRVRNAGLGKFRKALASGDYESIDPGGILSFYVAMDSAIVGHVARGSSSDVTFEITGYF